MAIDLTMDRQAGIQNPLMLQTLKATSLAVGLPVRKTLSPKTQKEYIFYFDIGSVSTEQLRNIITSSTTMDTYSSYKDSENTNNGDIQKATETKQQTGQVLDELNRIEKEEGIEIQEITVGETQITKNELSLKEIILEGNEHYYKNEYDEAIECYDKALEINPNHADALNNKGMSLHEVGKYR